MYPNPILKVENLASLSFSSRLVVFPVVLSFSGTVRTVPSVPSGTTFFSQNKPVYTLTEVASLRFHPLNYDYFYIPGALNPKWIWEVHYLKLAFNRVVSIHNAHGNFP